MAASFAAAETGLRRWAGPLSWLALALLVLLGLVLLHPEQVLAVLGRASLPWLLAGLALRTALIPLDAWVQQGHLRRLDVHLDLRTMLRIEAASMPLKLVLPAKSGALSKPTWLGRQAGMDPSTAVGFLLVYKLISLAGTVSWIGLALVLARPAVLGSWGLPLGVAALLSATLGCVVGGWLARRPHTARGPLGRVFEALARAGAPLDGPGSLRVIAPMYLVQLGQLAGSYLAFRAVAVALPVLDFAWRFGLAAIVGGLPGTPAGLGSRELVAALTMSDLFAPEAVVAASLLSTVVAQAWPALLGLPWVPRYLREMALGREP